MRFFKHFGTILIALSLAVLVWIAAVREQNPPREDDYNHNLPLEIIPPAEGLITTDLLPEFVRLRLLAPESSWKNLRPSKFKALIDLSKLEEGFNDVSIKVDVSDPQIEIVEQTPNEVSINIETVQSITLPVEVEVLSSPPLGYINRTPTVEPAIVQVTGPASLIKQIDKAVSEIFIRNSKETRQVSRDVLIQNREGQTIRGLDLNPSKIEITVPIEQQFGYKDVSVRVQVQGQVAPGYRVKNISVDPPTLTVVGKPKGLSEVGRLIETTPINLDGATEDIIRIVPLNLPDGVTVVTPESDTEGPDGVKVTVEITPIEDAVTLKRPVTQQGIDSNYWWRATPNQVDVFLSGPLPQLDTLRASDIEVIVDLFDLEPGVHTLQPTVFNKPDNLHVDAILPDTLEVTIGRTLQRPVIQRELDPEYLWTASPNRVSVQLSGTSEQLQRLNSNDVQVLVDLADLEPGSYRVRPLTSLPIGLELDSILPAFIDIIIQLRATPTLTATGTLSVTGTPYATKTATPKPKKDD